MGQWQEKMQYGHCTELWLQQTRRKLDFMHDLLFHLVLIGPRSKEAMMLLWVSLEQCQLRTFCPTVLVYSHPSKWPWGPLRKDRGDYCSLYVPECCRALPPAASCQWDPDLKMDSVRELAEIMT